MNHPYSSLLIFPILFVLIAIGLMDGQTDSPDSKEEIPVNAVIGDESYMALYGQKPPPGTPDSVRIRTHLIYVENLLRNRTPAGLTPQQQQNRSRYLDLLNTYIDKAEFPSNDGHPDNRRPVFLDKRGHICAVGYLIRETLGDETAEMIGRAFKYAYIPDIDHPVFNSWVEKSGFTTEELAMIQPAYDSPVPEVRRNQNQISLSYGAGSAFLTGTNIIYLTNKAKDPWLFETSSASHWFGLASGTGSLLLGILNLDNNRTYIDPLGDVNCVLNCSASKVTETNHARTVLSAANIGIGVVSIFRAGYHLARGNSPGTETSAFNIGQTNIDISSRPGTGMQNTPSLVVALRF